MNILKSLLPLLLLIGSAPLNAGGDIEAVIWSDRVDDLLQESDETEHDFTVRVMQRFRAFTKQTGFEASGHLCRAKDGRMGITLVTWGAHFSSPHMGACPNETPIIGAFVHSHPEPGIYTMSAQDEVVSNSSKFKFKVNQKKTVKVSKWAAQQFSDLDYAIGPGYLVSGDVVLHQAGRGTRRVVMQLP